MTLKQLKQDYIDQLQSDTSVEKVEEHITQVEWVDGFTGEKYVHHVDLTIHRTDGMVEHIDFAVDAFPLTKYLYAQNQLKNWKLVSVNPTPISW